MKVLKLFHVFSVESPCLTAIQQSGEYYCSTHLDLGCHLNVPVSHYMEE